MPFPWCRICGTFAVVLFGAGSAEKGVKAGLTFAIPWTLGDHKTSTLKVLLQVALICSKYLWLVQVYRMQIACTESPFG